VLIEARNQKWHRLATTLTLESAEKVKAKRREKQGGREVSGILIKMLVQIEDVSWSTDTMAASEGQNEYFR
jgi:hypothetical protein